MIKLCRTNVIIFGLLPKNKLTSHSFSLLVYKSFLSLSLSHLRSHTRAQHTHTHTRLTYKHKLDANVKTSPLLCRSPSPPCYKNFPMHEAKVDSPFLASQISRGFFFPWVATYRSFLTSGERSSVLLGVFWLGLSSCSKSWRAFRIWAPNLRASVSGQEFLHEMWKVKTFPDSTK